MDRAAIRLGLACLLMGALGACGAPTAREIRYIGDVTPEMACGVATHGTLTTGKGRFTFAPSDGVLLFSGDVGDGGALAATLTTTGADRKPYAMRFEGVLTADHVRGRYVTPRCAFAVRLDRSTARPFEVPYL
jgi:hypothetical protein